MNEVRPFRAHRYDLGRVGSLSDVVAPPYDVIDSVLQNGLYDRSPYNVIRLELSRDEPGDDERNNRYSRAARTLRDWEAKGIVAQDSARSFYVYHQEFEQDGQRHTRRGFLGRVRLTPFGAGNVYAHEETLAGPKADRLKLYRSTAMNLSPVFGLYPDESNEVQRLLDKAIAQTLPIEASDHLGVVSRLWAVTDQQVLSSVTGMMGPKPIFIADGHHRYETGLAYQKERRELGEIANDEAAANFILMMMVSMNDPGLIIMPTHRLVSGLGAMSADTLRRQLQSTARIEYVGRGSAGAREVWELIQADSTQKVLGFGTATDQTWLLARFHGEEEMARLASDHSADWRGLAVSVLHVLVLGKLLGPESELTCRYVHLLRECTVAVDKHECDVAVLVPPATMDHVQRIAGTLEKMPPKSTYFYPKLLSGLVFNSLAAS